MLWENRENQILLGLVYVWNWFFIVLVTLLFFHQRSFVYRGKDYVYLATDDIINTACFFRFNNNIIWSQSSSASWFISQRVWNWSCLMKIHCILILISLLNPIQKEKIFRELFIGAFLFLNRKFTTMIRTRTKFDVLLVYIRTN